MLLVHAFTGFNFSLVSRSQLLAILTTDIISLIVKTQLLRILTKKTNKPKENCTKMYEDRKARLKQVAWCARNKEQYRDRHNRMSSAIK